MKKQSGFTLIELVIVIIILGILAATAVPKFIDLQADAQKAAMTGVKGALEGAASITYSKSAIEGSQTVDGDVTATTANGVAISFGYPMATVAALKEAAGLSESDWVFDVDTAETAIITSAGRVDDNGDATDADLSVADGAGCNVTYVQAATAADRPTITVHTDGC